MNYLISAAAGLIAGAVLVHSIESMRKSRKRRQAKKEPRRKIEFSKFILLAVLITYFIGFVVAIKIVFIDVSQLGVFLTYVGAPTGSSIGFYAWKAKAENVVKIAKENPKVTGGTPVDVNNITP